MADIDTLVKELGQLTVLEALELSKKLSKEWNIDLDNLQAAPAQAPAVATESSTVTVMLTGFGENCPGKLKEDIEKEEAEKLKKVLEEAGGTVELK